MENEKLIRMCIVCRKREKQYLLNRFQCIENKLSQFTGEGRSFYVCASCINNKKFFRYISKICNISKEEAKKQIFHFPFSISH